MVQVAANIDMKPFGSLPDGSPIELYTLRSQQLEVSVTTFGARVVDVKFSPQGLSGTSVVLGYKSLPLYLVDEAYMGALVGRYANRIANARFTLGSSTFNVSRNDGAHSLHGGRCGFDQRVWSATSAPHSLTLSYLSKAGEEGFPGELRATVRYTVAENELQLVYQAMATADTPVNLTNHMYFNLSGDPGSDILNHIVTLHADQFTPVDPTLIPTGEFRDVTGTPFDFRRPRAIGDRIDEPDPQLVIGQGYDHNWVLKGPGTALKLAAEVLDPQSGRRVEVLTTEPGLQFYTGNQLGSAFGESHGRRCGFCLETQHFPDSPNQSHFPTTILGAGKVYRSETSYRFWTSD